MSEQSRSRVEPGHKRVRVMFGGEIVADTIRPLLVWEKPYYPTYYFPAADVRRDLLVSTGDSERSPSRGDAERFTLRVGDRTAESAVGYRETSPVDELADTYTFDWVAGLISFYNEKVDIVVDGVPQTQPHTVFS